MKRNLLVIAKYLTMALFLVLWVPAIPFLLLCAALNVYAPLNPFGEILGD